ncbi:MAG: PaaI family thioesterase [Desulfuromonadales bacterium]|nr:PaaI family thioesterase [Desulfuromonadales bacterium]MDW7758072.1 PaaI family thioesterase [Desulfuromonadales bacterium]
MEILDDGQCFVCGADNPIGLKVHFSIDKDRRSAVGKVSIPASFQGWQDIVHGGIIATLLDETCIYACRSIGDHFVTAEIAVKYLRPVPTQREVVVTAEITEEKKRILLVQAELKIEDQVYAKAQAKVFRVEQP